ncbi:MAG: hypothetical protein M1829_006247 [Trizodia sp. TS-e1964]|nr:MAG: hypothetical protein M1829_006247 [Trizodia sp. TS-e1964]
MSRNPLGNPRKAPIRTNGAPAPRNRVSANPSAISIVGSKSHTAQDAKTIANLGASTSFQQNPKKPLVHYYLGGDEEFSNGEKIKERTKRARYTALERETVCETRRLGACINCSMLAIKCKRDEDACKRCVTRRILCVRSADQLLLENFTPLYSEVLPKEIDFEYLRIVLTNAEMRTKIENFSIFELKPPLTPRGTPLSNQICVEKIEAFLMENVPVTVNWSDLSKTNVPLKHQPKLYDAIRLAELCVKYAVFITEVEFCHENSYLDLSSHAEIACKALLQALIQIFCKRTRDLCCDFITIGRALKKKPPPKDILAVLFRTIKMLSEVSPNAVLKASYLMKSATLQSERYLRLSFQLYPVSKTTFEKFALEIVPSFQGPAICMALQVLRRDSLTFSFSPHLQINPFLDYSRVKLRDIKRNMALVQVLESRIDHPIPVVESFSPNPLLPVHFTNMPQEGSLPSMTHGESGSESFTPTTNEGIISQINMYSQDEPGIFAGKKHKPWKQIFQANPHPALAKNQYPYVWPDGNTDNEFILDPNSPEALAAAEALNLSYPPRL